ncbi:MAG: pyroglutamyl-peptidase I [Halanaerobiales bacterium]|nr:pyroglutamyl-peptidase I [Halanaerobiales bacterium]
MEVAELKKVLLSGFEPFGGETINPSLELIHRLKDESWDGLEVHLVQLPVVFGDSVEKLKEAITEVNPDVVIGIGQAGGRTALSIERVAINIDDAIIADNDGKQPVDRSIEMDGSEAYFSTIPIKRMMKAALEAGVPTMVSNSAGTYVCNHLMYGILHLLRDTNKRGGFIHIPFLPEQVVKKPNQPSMSLDTMIKGFKAMIMETILEEKDEKLAAGTLD